MRDVFVRSLADASLALESLRSDSDALDALDAIASKLLHCFASGGKVLVCGNGGSLADSMHFAEEWTGRFRNDRPPYPVIALCDPTHLTCVGNDYGFDRVFARSITALARDGDLVFLLTTSGNSRNLVLAAEAAHSRSASVIGFLGQGGGELLALCDIAFIAPGKTADRIQELHMLALHSLIEAVESRL